MQLPHPQAIWMYFKSTWTNWWENVGCHVKFKWKYVLHEYRFEKNGKKVRVEIKWNLMIEHYSHSMNFEINEISGF